MSSCRFPKLEECAHFHYELVQLGSLTVSLVDDKSDTLNTSSLPCQSLNNEDTHLASQQLSSTSTASASISGPSFLNYWFIMKVKTSNSEQFLIKRSFDNVRLLDEMLHRCVFDRKISSLKNLSYSEYDCSGADNDEINEIVKKYFERLSNLANDSITCGKILTWFQLDNKGRRLPLADTEIRKSINTPAVGAAYGVRKYIAQAPDEISIDVGDMISVIDMPSPTESIWWRGKKNHLQKSQYEVGFFPQNCVATIGDKIPRNIPLLSSFSNPLNEEASPIKPVLKKHGKLIAFFRSFILSRPSRRRLKQRGIYRERVFSCDLSEHLLNSGQNIPIILKTCAEFLEKNGIVDGIYRLSGITSNIQKLRRSFDEERIPDMNSPDMIKDIHAVSSVLKMYFRELPNPLCTYQLYDYFVDAIQKRDDDSERLRLMKETVLKLPPPHYRTLKYLAMHLNNISKHSNRTGMTDKNLAIVWAPNLLRSPAIESGGITALRGVGIQAVVTEYLIKNYSLIFEAPDSLETIIQEHKAEIVQQDFSSITSEQSYDSSISIIDKTKFFNPIRPNLISLQEARERQMKSEQGVNLWNKPNASISESENVDATMDTTNEQNTQNGSSSSLKKYHTLLPVPRTWQKRKTTSWKSLFSKSIKTSTSSQEIKLYKYVYPSSDKELGCVGEEALSSNKSPDIKQKLSPIAGENNKSPDIYGRKPIEVYVRSSSVDSVKTVQCHSRSVSHDSYFGNILQSPILNLKSFCCKEFTELVLNFDREEPEMRIFSESESLLSSPKDGFCSSCRKVRPDLKELTNIINNQSDSNFGIPVTSQFASTLKSSNQHENDNTVDNQEYCSQYNLEDHLSDIEFIDSFTPEHTYNQNPSIQNHSYNNNNNNNQHKSSLNKLSNLKQSESMHLIENSQTYEKHKPKLNEGMKNKCGRSVSFHELKSGSLKKQSNLSRYSYPNIMTNNAIFENEILNDESDNYTNERYSIKNNSDITTSSTAVTLAIQQKRRDISSSNENVKMKFLRNNSMSELRRSRDLNLYGAGELFNTMNTRSSSSDTISSTNDNKHLKITDMRTLSATTLSSTHSPRYTLLLLDTCSEPSTTMNTPVGNFNILNKIEEENLKANKSVSNDEEMLCSFEQNIPDLAAEQDKDNLKQKLHLDLCSVTSGSEHLLNSPVLCNNSNMTITSDNTSQSLTPSEFGYLAFTRQSNAVSSENSPNLENFECFEAYRELSSSTASPRKSANILCDITSMAASNINQKQYGVKNIETVHISDNLDNLKKDEESVKCNQKDLESPITQNKKLWEKPSPKRKKESSRFTSIDIVHDHQNKNNASSTNAKVEDSSLVELRQKDFTRRPFVSVKEIATKFEGSRDAKVISAPTPINIHKSTLKKDEKAKEKIRNGTKASQKNSISSRSLDENAFNVCIKSDNRFSENLQSYNDSKHKSVEISMPKLLNPPKFLPNDYSETNSSKTKESKKFPIKSNNISKQSKFNTSSTSLSSATITNEISNLKNNNSQPGTLLTLSNSNLMSNSMPNEFNLLSGVKLDRERIEKIKEQRRHQLIEKHQNIDSFPPKISTKRKDSLKLDIGSDQKTGSVVTKLNLSPVFNQEINLAATVHSSCKKRVEKSIKLNNFPANSSSSTSSSLLKNNSDNFENIKSNFNLSAGGIDDTTIESHPESSKIPGKLKTENFPVFKIRDVTAIFESRSQNI